MFYIDNLSVDVESWYVDKKINKYFKFFLIMLFLWKMLIKWIKYEFFLKKGFFFIDVYKVLFYVCLWKKLMFMILIII